MKPPELESILYRFLASFFDVWQKDWFERNHQSLIIFDKPELGGWLCAEIDPDVLSVADFIAVEEI